MSNKIIRSICYFSSTVDDNTISRIDGISEKLIKAGYQIQTKRICSPRSNYQNIQELENKVNNSDYRIGLGTVNYQDLIGDLNEFYSTKMTNVNVDLAKEELTLEHTKVVFEIIKNNPSLTFNFTYGFNIPGSSPYFPSACYQRDGFSVGLQPTDLSEDCKSLEDWFEKMEIVWNEVNQLFADDADFLGIDSSIAPLFTGLSSLINFVKRLGMGFDESVVTDTYTKITKFIKEKNPKAIGLCGLMLPCLEDFELADEYEQGKFTIERNVFLSLHSGLGIDTYPIGIDENPKKVLNILKLIQALSNKYQKPLAVRFVSDGKAKIGEKTNFENQYLKDITVKCL